MKAKITFILLAVLLFNSLVPAGGRVRAAASSIVPILYVAPSGDCAGMTPCYGSPQAAADAAQPGSFIRIAAGSYTPLFGESQVLHLTKSLIFQGGYRLTDWYDAQPNTFPTILDAQHLGRGILIDGNPDQPVEIALNGIQIQNGQTTLGGGVSGTGVALTMKRCVVSDNQASYSGGGIFLANSSSFVLEASHVIRNTAGDMGGGIALNSPNGNSSLTQSWISGNSAVSGGGGLSLAGGQVTLKTIMLVDNSVTLPAAAGAGLAAGGARITLMHATVARNTGGTSDGLNLSGASTLTATDSLIAGQKVGLSFTTPSTGTVDGVLWGGGTTWANGANTAGGGSVSVQLAYTGDPLFAGLDPANLKAYFHISASSPARDRAVSTPAGYEDIETQPVYTSIADLGADEYFAAIGSNIRVEIEPGGDIEVGTADGIPENTKGAMFWNGSKWVTNDTAAHPFFTDAITRDRIKQYTLVADLNGSSQAEQDIWNYHVSRSSYTYLVPAQGGGTYQIEAARYRLTRSDTQDTILLNSRGNGYGQASFDIYIQNSSAVTIAIRDGSAWFNYSETPDLASQRSINDPTGRTGILTTCDPQAVDRSRYWFDSNGGSDMGGLTYFFHTSSLPNHTSVLGACFPDEFRVKYMDATNLLKEFRLRPVVYSETLRRANYLPLLIR